MAQTSDREIRSEKVPGESWDPDCSEQLAELLCCWVLTDSEVELLHDRYAQLVPGSKSVVFDSRAHQSRTQELHRQLCRTHLVPDRAYCLPGSAFLCGSDLRPC